MTMQHAPTRSRAWWLVAGALLPATAAAAPGDFQEPDVQVLHELAGDAGGGSFGWAVSELRDVDGDGAGDALAGAPFNTTAGANAGAAYAFSGRSGAPLFTWTGAPDDALGYALADAGDVDGDGLSDIIVGAPGFSGPGKAYLYSGADGSQLHVFVGTGEAGSFGSAVAGAGDLDGDGRADILVGAETDPTGGMNAGRVAAFSGADHAALWAREGAVGAFLGSGAAPLGDVDDDGVPDVVVGARGAGAAGKGAVYVLSGVDGGDLHPPHEAGPTGGNLGQFFVAGVGDLDGDGVPDVYAGDYADAQTGTNAGRAYVWSGVGGEQIHEFAGAAAGDGLGPGRGGGDADGDGTPDLAIGAYGLDPAGVKAGGRVTLYSGATGQPIRTISGGVEQLQIGFDVVTLGDVDDDGRDDLVLSGAFLGRTFIVSGAPAPPDETTGETTDSTTASTTIATSNDSTAADTTAATGSASTSADPTATDGTGAPATSTSPATSSDGDDSTSDTTGADTPGGCGCTSTPAPAPLALLLLLLPRRPRQRGATSPPPKRSQ